MNTNPTLGVLFKDAIKNAYAQQAGEQGDKSVAKNIEASKIIENILFEKNIVPGNNGTIYKSSAPGRKIAILNSGSNTVPNENTLYDVKIIKDTNPEDPNSGKFIVEIINEGIEISEAIREGFNIAKNVQPIEIDEDNKTVLVMESLLPYANKQSKEVPNPKSFEHFTLDERTLETLNKIATSIELKQPCLLEGETSTSKTSSIEYLAMRTKNEFVRFNLNGQTDTSEIIGKYVPNDGQLQITFENMLKNPELLTPQTREILAKANADGRGLNDLEAKKIASLENLPVAEWRWQDGLLPEAMKKGKWIVFDEINLAEAAILERLNSVLEKNPSLTLSENGGFKIGEGGNCEVNENFRILATMNPAEYSGRKPMSPAYKDRWTSYMYVQAPTEKDYEAMINLMTYGKQPKIKIGELTYQGLSTQPMFESLNQIPNFDGFIPKLTKFQSVLEKMSQKGEIGRDKKEPYIFTRRGLIDLMHYLDKKTFINRRTKKPVSITDNPKEVINRAIEYFYLDKISDPDDRKKVTDQMDAIGISRKNFLHNFTA